MFCSVIVVARDGQWEPSSGIIYVVFMCCVIAHGVLASCLSKIMGKLQTVFVLMVRFSRSLVGTWLIGTSRQNLALIVGTIIALPVGRAHSRNDGEYIFTNIQNLAEWPTGWTFMLAVSSNHQLLRSGKC